MSEISRILSCPRCNASHFNFPMLQCKHCGLTCFELEGLPCLFPSGAMQRQLWNHLFSAFIDENNQTLSVLEEQLRKRDLSSLSKHRLALTIDIHKACHQQMVEFLSKAGLTSEKNAKYQDYSTKIFSKYYALPLRDWAWNLSPQTGVFRGSLRDENQLALEHILYTVGNLTTPENHPRRVLVIGAGAGRLSWDLHCAIKPSLTVALDFNPLLSCVSKALINDRKEIEWCEKIEFPHDGLPTTHQWKLKCDGKPEILHESWFPILADAWSMPFAQDSFDLVVTPWFIDVTGKDLKQLIAKIDKVLAPGGQWINYGPFLYNPDLPEPAKYTAAEIKELLELSNFTIFNENFFQTPYACSPLNNNGRLEQVWCVVARSITPRNSSDHQVPINAPIHPDKLPPWLIMPHLPIPPLKKKDLFPEELTNIANLIDGKHSFNDIKDLLSPHIPEGYEAEEVLLDILFEYLVKK